jgi:hypothetical protein
MPIGMAFGAGCTEAGLATWRLTVHGAGVPGLWMIVDREFKPVEGWRSRVFTAILPSVTMVRAQPTDEAVSVRPGRPVGLCSF